MSIVAVAGSAFTFYIPGLEDQANPGLFKSSPTIAAGDFTLSINGGAFDSLDNTPTVAPAGGTQIKIILSATETTAAADGGKITVLCQDAAGAEWYSAGFVIDVRAADLPTATEVVAAIDADPPGVDLQLWLGGTPDLLSGSGKVPATISETVSAHVVRYNYQWMCQANVTSVSGNVLTASSGIIDPESTALADDSLVALVGWQVMFAKTVSGFPPVDVFWRTTIVSYTLTTITVEDMPAQDLSSGGFTAYILPPGFGASAGGGLTAQETRDAMMLAPTAGAPAAGSVDAHLDDILEDTGTTLPGLISAGGGGGGAITFVYTLTSAVDATPIADADVWVTTDEAGSNVVASGRTDQNGQVTFYLDAGTVYVWRQKSGWDFSKPDAEVVA